MLLLLVLVLLLLLHAVVMVVVIVGCNVRRLCHRGRPRDARSARDARVVVRAQDRTRTHARSKEGTACVLLLRLLCLPLIWQ